MASRGQSYPDVSSHRPDSHLKKQHESEVRLRVAGDLSSHPRSAHRPQDPAFHTMRLSYFQIILAHWLARAFTHTHKRVFFSRHRNAGTPEPRQAAHVAELSSEIRCRPAPSSTTGSRCTEPTLSVSFCSRRTLERERILALTARPNSDNL